jgi:hypothetical protein
MTNWVRNAVGCTHSSVSRDDKEDKMRLDHWGPTDVMHMAGALGKTPSQYPLHPLNVEGQIETLEKAAQLSPDEWAVWHQLAQAYQKKKRYADFFRAANRCVNLKPKDVRSMFTLAQAYDDLGNGILDERARKNFLAATDGKFAKEVAESLAQTKGVKVRPDAAARLAAFLGKTLPDLAGVDRALTELGMTPETAVAEAERWYDRTLKVVDYSQRKDVEFFLNELRHKAGRDK